MKARRCVNCDTVAVAVAPELAHEAVAEHNARVQAAVAADPELLYWVRNAYIEDYEYCSECSAPWTTFVAHDTLVHTGPCILYSEEIQA